MKFLDALLGRTKPKPANLDALFAIPNAAISLEAAAGLKPAGSAAVCFRPASVGAPLVLRWSPDEGLFCCQTDVKLTGYQNAPSPSST